MPSLHEVYLTSTKRAAYWQRVGDPSGRIGVRKRKGGVLVTVRIHGLTERQWEVARLVADGLSNKEIAIELCIEPSTVGSHVHEILGLFGFRKRSQIAAWVVGAMTKPPPNDG